MNPAESELYYLGSRYYDAEVGRFISLDIVSILTASPNAISDKNLYSYCFNNPLFYIDIQGYIPQAVEDKVVHDSVLRDICMLNPTLSWKKTCIYYNGKDFKGGFGFCDLYNNDTGEVWELKKDSLSSSCSTEAHVVRKRHRNN